MNLGLENKKVLIVGASKGIGRSIALNFAKEGSEIICLSRDKNKLKKLIEKADKYNNKKNHFYSVDLMKENPSKFASKLLKEFQYFDVVIHNVGGSLVSRNYLGSLEEWMDALKFNAGIAIDMNHKLIPTMIKRGSGKIIHISSISAQMLRGNPLYASAKAFLNAYVKTVGRSIADTGVVINAIMPGAVSFKGSYWDKLIKTDPDKCNDFLNHHQAVKRFGTTDEIANITLFMASDLASFMQASIVPVDGGNM